MHTYLNDEFPYQSLTLRISLCKVLMSSKLPLSITEYTKRNPSPVCMYCSRMALNSWRDDYAS